MYTTRFNRDRDLVMFTRHEDSPTRPGLPPVLGAVVVENVAVVTGHHFTRLAFTEPDGEIGELNEAARKEGLAGITILYLNEGELVPAA